MGRLRRIEGHAYHGTDRNFHPRRTGRFFGHDPHAYAQRQGHDPAGSGRYAPPRIGERVEGVIARRIDLESGPYALVEKSREFTLVPWRDVLERNIGKAASGIMRESGINWRFGRERSGPQIT